MSIEIKVPNIGADELEVTEILVKVGDKVETEQSLITLEGDKASIEVPSPFSGLVEEIKIKIGDKVSTGSLIMLFAEENTELNSISAPILKGSTKSSQDKKLEMDNKNTEKIEQSEFTEKNLSSYVHATPLIRRVARDLGVNLSKLTGTGRKGRILREDIKNYVIKALKRFDESPTITAEVVENRSDLIPDMLPWPKIDFSKFGEIEEIDLGRIQKISGATMIRNWIMIPHVTHFDKIDITDLEAFRKQQNVEAENRKEDIKFTLVVFIMKVISLALKEMPRFNSSLSEGGKHLILKKYIHIGIAVDTPNGLVVPVFKNVNKKSISELSRELSTITKKARDGKLTLREMQGGCFTISSIGNLGTTYFSPIVNAPEVAILGISKSAIEPVWNGKEFTPRLMMPISLSFDHRVIDGADGARFITLINSMMSDIRRLLM